MRDIAINPCQLRSLQPAFGLLLQAHEYAQALGRASWDFAVGLCELQALGVSHNNLRWLLAQGLVEHALEIPATSGKVRAFEPRPNWSFGSETCFILTAAGVAIAAQLCDGDSDPSPAIALSEAPSWDSERRTLSYRGNVIKRFKVPAPNQELILAVFEEESWPYRIDDPLPLVHSIEPKRRLHDTINALNRHQRIVVVRFFGDGQGVGICWEPVTLIT